MSKITIYKLFSTVLLTTLLLGVYMAKHKIYGIDIENPHYCKSFVIGTNTQGIESICSAQSIYPNIFVTNAHCISGLESISLGCAAKTQVLRDSEKTIVDGKIHPDWQKENYSHDIALIQSARGIAPLSSISYYNFARAEIGCNYYSILTTYDQNEKGQVVINDFKKTPLCITSVSELNLGFHLSDSMSLICKGDSGAAIFDQNNKIVGLITAQDGANCSNKGLAVSILAEYKFIIDSIEQQSRTNLVSKCGESCENNTCAFGLFCGEDNFCQNSFGTSCLSEVGEFCSNHAQVSCNRSSCNDNVCKDLAGENIKKVSPITYGIYKYVKDTRFFVLSFLAITLAVNAIFVLRSRRR